jgi:putative Holliday junction resolvase
MRRRDISHAHPTHLVRILGLDLGEKRIGVAISQLGGTLALPDGVIPRRSWAHVIAEIRARLDAVQADRIVVGLPLRMDGTEGSAAMATRKFVQRLQATVSVPVDVQDERLSTAEAERSLIAADMRRRRRRAVRDAVAAAIMLQTYLDRRR